MHQILSQDYINTASSTGFKSTRKLKMPQEAALLPHLRSDAVKY